MMPAVLRSLLLATERQGLQAAARGSRALCGSIGGQSAAAAQLAAGRSARPAAASLHSACFAASAVPDAQATTADAAADAALSSRDSWLQLPRVTPGRASYGMSSAAVRASESEGEDAEEAGFAAGFGGADAGAGPASAPGQLHRLDEQSGSEEEEEGEAPELDWSDAEEPGEAQPRQSRFSPHGPRPRHRWPREKRRAGVGPPAVVPPLPRFEAMLPRLRAYREQWGDCLVPRRYWQDWELGDWAYRVRILLRDKQLGRRQFEALDAMGFPWVVPVEVAAWEFMFHEMRRYREEFGHLDVPFRWKDPMADFNNHFSRWFHAQPTLFLQRRLRPDQVRKLMLAGYDLREVTGDFISRGEYVDAQTQIASSSDRNEFEIMFAELEAWKAAYYTTIVPRQVYDNPVLGAWCWKLRRDHRKSRLAQWKVDRLDSIEFHWKPDAQSTKWHHCLHEARRYKEVHGTGHVPADYTNPAEPGWVEASRWLQRQAKLFRKQKLPDKRYRILREVLGIKFVRQYAPRVKQNRERAGIQTEQGSARRRVPKYAPPIRRDVLI